MASVGAAQKARMQLDEMIDMRLCYERFASLHEGESVANEFIPVVHSEVLLSRHAVFILRVQNVDHAVPPLLNQCACTHIFGT